MHAWAQLGEGHGGRVPATFFSLGFVIYWFHTNLPRTFYNKILLMDARPAATLEPG